MHDISIFSDIFVLLNYQCIAFPKHADLSASFVGNSPIVSGNTVTFDLSLGSGVTAARCALLIGDRLKNETDCKSNFRLTALTRTKGL